MMEGENSESVPRNVYPQAREDRHQREQNLRKELGSKLRQILLQKNLKQRELSVLMDIQQPEVSHLFNGHFSRFSVDKLVQLFNRLGFVVKFQIYPCEVD